jgi:hypothetical protein
MITESDAIKFQKLYEEKTGESISLDEAFEMAESLVSMIRYIYKPIKKENSDQCTSSESAIE